MRVFEKLRNKKDTAKPIRRRVHTVTPEEDALLFRRSRTLTGSLHSEVRAASEERGNFRSERLQEHDLRKHRKRVMFLLSGLLVGIGLLGYVLSSYVYAIESVRVLGVPEARSSDTAVYQQHAKEYFQKNPFERFRFLLSKHSLSTYLQQKSPEVISAEVASSPRFMSGELVIRIRRPVAVWNSGSQQYFVSDDGVTFKHNILPLPGVTITDKSANTELGSTAASGKMLQFIGRVVSIVNQSGVGKVASVELPANSTRQVDVLLEGKPFVIKTHLDRDPAGQAADIVNALKYFQTKGITPKYIDVRVSSKAFYQ